MRRNVRVIATMGALLGYPGRFTWDRTMWQHARVQIQRRNTATSELVPANFFFANTHETVSRFASGLLLLIEF